MNSLQPPNYTQIPNILFDEWMYILTPAAFKVVMCLCRKIFGWHKTTDTISKNQLMKMTGISKNTVQKALDELIGHGLITKTQFSTEYGYQPNVYALYIKKPEDELYTDQNLGGGRSNSDPGVGQILTQGVGQILTLQKKDSTKETLTKENIAQSPATHRPEQRPEICFSSSSGKFTGINKDDLKSWKTAFPDINISQELSKAEQWILANPSKSKKKLWRKFLVGWFIRSNEKSENQKAYRSQNGNYNDRRTKNIDGTPVESPADGLF